MQLSTLQVFGRHLHLEQVTISLHTIHLHNSIFTEAIPANIHYLAQVYNSGASTRESNLQPSCYKASSPNHYTRPTLPPSTSALLRVILQTVFAVKFYPHCPEWVCCSPLLSFGPLLYISCTPDSCCSCTTHAHTHTCKHAHTRTHTHQTKCILKDLIIKITVTVYAL